MKISLTGVLENGTPRVPGVIIDTRTTLEIPIGIDVQIHARIIYPNGSAVELTESGTSMIFTVKKFASDAYVRLSKTATISAGVGVGYGGSAAGVSGTGGPNNGVGGDFTAVGSGTGITAQGGPTLGNGGEFTAGGTGPASGVQGFATGAGNGVYGNSPSGVGVKGLSLLGRGVWAEGDTTSAPTAPFRIVPQDATPTTGMLGDLCVVGGKLYICTTASPVAWTVVGAQTA